MMQCHVVLTIMLCSYVLHTTNKTLAHSTNGFSKSKEASKLIEIAFRGDPKIFRSAFRGKKIGQDYIGCSDFPDCRFYFWP